MLRALYIACGSPRYQMIIELAPRLKDLYPGLLGQEPATFSKTAISEVLHGHRAGLPDPWWVACFVLCCQRLGAASGHLASDPGHSSLAGWQQRLREAEEEATRLGLPVRRGPRAQADARPAGTVPAPTEPATGFGVVPAPRWPSDDRSDVSAIKGPIWLTEANYEYVSGYKPFGRELLVGALARDPHAVYQVAILLAPDATRAADALKLLSDAATRGHPRALALLQASPRILDRRLAAAHARDLANLANDAGHTSAAQAFNQCVARFAMLDAAATGSDDSIQP